MAQTGDETDFHGRFLKASATFVRLVCPRRCFRHSVVYGNSAGIAPSIAPYNRVMARSLIWVALMAIVTALYPSGAFGEFVCGPTPRTCAVFLNAKAMFRGRVIAVDRRLGLVRIRVEERFKGVANETQEVWIDPKWTGPGGFIEDPGPDYREGEDWLVVASAFDLESWKKRFQVTIVDVAGRQFYTDYTLCPDAGSRRTDSSKVNQILSELRAYRDGKPLARDCRR
jgi:hypothetical protein